MARILHILDHSLPLQSGYTFRTRAILKAQVALGLEVRSLTGPRYNSAPYSEERFAPEEHDGLFFYRTSGEARGLPLVREWREIGLFAKALDQVIEEWRPDMLHAHSPVLCGKAALRVARKHGIPCVYEIRAFWEDAAVGNGTGHEGSLKYYLTRGLETHVVKQADAVVTICDGLRSDLCDRGVPAEKITIMPNGVDLGLFGAPRTYDLELAKQLGFVSGEDESSSTRSPVIGFIGSFYDYEGLDVLIKAMEGVVSRQPQARLLLVGGGPCADALKVQAEASPAAKAIHFMGRVPHAEVDRYYSLCDVMAYPRKHSRLTDLVTPLKPLEAMAQGRLVAASDVGGHRELIEDGRTGVLFTPDDPAACAEALVRLLGERSVWPRYRANGQKHVKSRHNWANNAQGYVDIYEKLLRR